MLITEWVEHSE